MPRLMDGSKELARSAELILYDDFQKLWITPDCMYQDTEKNFRVEPTPEEDIEQAAKAALEAAKLQAITDGLPSWAAVEAAIDGVTTIAGIKVILKKLARVIYLTVKNKED